MIYDCLNLAQNAAQACPAHQLLKRPEFTSLLLTAQGVLIVTNAIFLVKDYINLSEDINNSPKSRLSIQHIIAAASIFSIAGVFFVSQAYKPSIDLKDTLKTVVKLSVQEIESVQVYWDAPFTHKFGQFLSLNRIAVNLFSMFIASGAQSLNFISTIAMQAFAVHKNAQAPWIKFEKTFIPPDGPFWSFPVPQEFMSKLALESHFLIPAGNLPSSLKHIYDYCANFFNHSKNWLRFWVPQIIQAPKPQLVKILIWGATVQPSPIEKTNCAPYANRMAAWAFDKLINRYVKVRLTIV